MKTHQILRKVSGRLYEIALRKILFCSDRALFFLIFSALLPIIMLASVVRDNSEVILICGYRDRMKGDKDSVEWNTLFRSVSKSLYAPRSFFFHYDVGYFPSSRLLLTIVLRRPHAIVLSSYNQKSYRNPTPLCLVLIKRLQTKVIFFWWDTCSNEFSRKNSNMFALADKNIVVDNPNKYFFSESDLTNFKFEFLYTPVVVPEFVQNLCGRQKRVFFCGSFGDYRSGRSTQLKTMQKSNLACSVVNVSIAPLSYTQYYAELNDSLCGVSLPESVDCDQLKARALEIMANGTLLIDRKNCQTDMVFADKVEFVSFQTEEELLALLNKIQKDPMKFERIAANGYKKVKEICNPNLYWQSVFKDIL